MAVDAVGSATNSSSSQGQVQQTTLGQEDLFKILLTQLSYQDPMKPMDNQEFITQLAQFNTLEQNRQVNQKLDSVLSVQSGNQAINLLGKSVQVQADSGSVVGTVTAVTFNQGSPMVTLKKSDGTYLSEIHLSQVVSVM